MVNYNLIEAKERTLDYLRYPIPRTPVSIVEYLKKEVDDFYPKTSKYRVVEKLRNKVLKDLLENNVIVRYTREDEIWEAARTLLNKRYEQEGKPKPRKLKELYQINFFYLSSEAQIYNLPVFKDVNISLTAIFYRFLEEKRVENFFWNILNLFYSYSVDENKGKIRLKIHSKEFSDKESRILERSLNHLDEFEYIFKEFPFKPDPEEAIKFLDKIK
ncbi:MAG: hypothetical protein ACOCT9_01875 [archaeon]